MSANAVKFPWDKRPDVKEPIAVAEPPVASVVDAVLVLTDADVRAISENLSVNVRTKDDLLRGVRHLANISVDGIEITLEPYVLNRLKSRCLEKDFPQFVNRTVKELLTSYAGC